MVEEEFELSSDLEWMLLSGQVEQSALINKLVHEEFGNLYSLALSILDKSEKAWIAAKETIIWALLNAHRYNAQTGVQSWLAMRLLKTCHSGMERAIAENVRAGEFSPDDLDQIAVDIQAELERTEKRLRLWSRFQQIAIISVVSMLVILASKITDDISAETVAGKSAYQKIVVTEVVYLYPTQKPTSPPTPFPERAVLFRAKGGDTLADISNELRIDGEILVSLNAFPLDRELDPGQNVMIGIGVPPLSLITPTPVTPAPTPPPLTTESSNEEVYRRVRESRKNWHTLWADVVEMNYSSNGPVDGPHGRRYQVWISQPGYDQVLMGDLNGQIFRTWRRVSERGYPLNFEKGKRSLSNLDSLGIVEVGGSMLNPDRYQYPSDGQMAYLRVEEIAGRQSLVFDWYTENPADQSGQESYLGRFWVDTITGVILRWQQFVQDNRELLLKDLTVIDIVFDVDFPKELYDKNQPVQTRFASDYQGNPEP
jgi:hypothetical protein